MSSRGDYVGNRVTKERRRILGSKGGKVKTFEEMGMGIGRGGCIEETLIRGYGKVS